MSEPDDIGEAELVHREVNVVENEATEPDEGDVLRWFYGEPDGGGIYRGAGA